MKKNEDKYQHKNMIEKEWMTRVYLYEQYKQVNCSATPFSKMM